MRPKNEEVEVRSEFVVDTKVPKALIADVPIAEVSSQESATFQFSADDSTSVTFRCRLEFSNSNEDVRIARLETKETEMDLNTWFPCTSPETFRGFTYGDWTFKVQGKDAAGNEQVVLVHDIELTKNFFRKNRRNGRGERRLILKSSTSER